MKSNKTDKDSTLLFSGNKKFLLIMALAMILMTDTYKFHHADPEREHLWRLILGILTPLIICASAYLSYLVMQNKTKKIYLQIITALFFTSLLPMGYFYLGIDGFSLASFTITRNAVIGYLFAMTYDWYAKSIREKELEKQQLHSELASLKYQVNPHFLFNTLNNIDSLIKSDPDKASASVVELSGIMRYMIYDTRHETVALTDELKYITHFLELQKMQLANSNLIKYEVNGNAESIKIAPMLFIPFIENAFKHCTDKEKENAIQISFDISFQQIRFECVNIYNSQIKISKDKSSGIGLENVKRRLELLYNEKYTLAIEQKNDLYCVSLTIELL